ncbi:DNA polymerase III subunit delta' [Mesorhizobium denitrificans]|uniref:DNA polymerase III subunit delta n=1 Tax=Mesorhizobium denitrificans TaxID=2294114 RepID=A0A371XBL4_9HYPH|nr:DNA polymerase III subunit delta' [Mesorhizobium denitrificans]RFC66618.1 DNA polymerase III subunit delta' [Mesorhizobium denitrificans]
MSEERLAPQQHDSLEGIAEPSETPELVGHLEAQYMLLAAQKAGRLPHAIVLAGPQGIGKATFAFAFARHLLSGAEPGANFEPVAIDSPIYRQIASGAHPSVLHLTRPANDKTKGFKTVLSVDEIRRIGRFLSFTSGNGSYRVVIIDPADDMRAAAANALLKNLEEPPSRTIFILIAHSPGALLPTIRSRCQVIRLAPLNDKDLAEVLVRAGQWPDDERVSDALLARSEGSARNAIILQQYGGVEIATALDALATGSADIAASQRLAEAVSGRDSAIQLDVFNGRALELLANAAADAAQSGDTNRAKKLSDAWHMARIAITETATYNLDQKQHALTMISRLNTALKPQSGRM